jgi:hypothetical protein
LGQKVEAEKKYVRKTSSLSPSPLKKDINDSGDPELNQKFRNSLSLKKKRVEYGF